MVRKALERQSEKRILKWNVESIFFKSSSLFCLSPLLKPAFCLQTCWQFVRLASVGDYVKWSARASRWYVVSGWKLKNFPLCVCVCVRVQSFHKKAAWNKSEAGKKKTKNGHNHKAVHPITVANFKRSLALRYPNLSSHSERWWPRKTLHV